MIFTGSTCILGGEEGRISGWPAADSPHLARVPPPAVHAGTLAKQKTPLGNEPSVNKEAAVSLLFLSFTPIEMSNLWCLKLDNMLYFIGLVPCWMRLIVNQ